MAQTESMNRAVQDLVGLVGRSTDTEVKQTDPRIPSGKRQGKTTVTASPDAFHQIAHDVNSGGLPPAHLPAAERKA